ERLARTTGKGSAQEKNRLLRDLFARATQDEQEFLFRLLIGELRQGALEGLVTEAVARAAGLEADVVRRAAMLAGDLVAVARAATALRSDGKPLPCQRTMRRFGRKLDVDRLKAELPLASFFFDILYADGSALLDDPYTRRFTVLAGVVPAEQRVSRIVTAD